MAEIVRVGMAKMAVAKVPDSLETLALGSCVGIVLYDELAKVAGLSHAMLPDINSAKSTSRDNPAKFVDTAINALLEGVIQEGGVKRRMLAKLAGGANMFPDIATNGPTVGERNVVAAKEVLGALGIPIVSEDTGGSVGRTITFNIERCELMVRSIKQGKKII